MKPGNGLSFAEPEAELGPAPDTGFCSGGDLGYQSRDNLPPRGHEARGGFSIHSHD